MDYRISASETRQLAAALQQRDKILPVTPSFNLGDAMLIAQDTFPYADPMRLKEYASSIHLLSRFLLVGRS
jgi:hypothetical protein